MIGDLIGRFRLTNMGHGHAVRRVKESGIPFIMAGGGGYTIKNVARCWAYETGLVLGEELPN